MAEAVGIVNIKLKASTATLKAGLRSSVNDMRQWSRQAEGVFEATRTPLERYKFEVAKLNAMHKRGALDANTMARAQAQLRQQYISSVTAMQSQTTGAGKLLGSLGAMAGGYMIATKALGILNATMQRTEKLSQSMNRSLAIMGDVKPELRGDMRTAAIDVERSTIFSANEAADAFFFLASAGLDAKQSLAALPTVAKFAQAGNFDLARATDLLTDAQSALGLTVKDTAENMRNMNRVGDMLVAANTIANASVEQFSEALTNKAGAAARMYGLAMEEVTAMIAVFADQGVKGADAGTKVDIVLRDMTRKAHENADAFKKLKIDVFNADGSLRHMHEIVKDLETAMDTLSVREKKAMMMTLGFSEKSVSATLAMIGFSDKLKEVYENLQDVGGTMGEVAGKQMTDLEKATNKLNAELSTMADNLNRINAGKAAFIELHAVALERMNRGESPIDPMDPGGPPLPFGLRHGLDPLGLTTRGPQRRVKRDFSDEFDPETMAPAGIGRQVEFDRRTEATARDVESERLETERLTALRKEADKIKEGQRSAGDRYRELAASTKQMVIDFDDFTEADRQRELSDFRAENFKEGSAAKEAAKIEKDRATRREKLEDTLKTPLETFREKLDEYADLFGEGTDTYNALRDKLQDATVKEMMGDVRNQAVGTIAGMQLGSQGAQQFAAKLQADRIGGDLEKRERARIRKAVEEIAEKDDVIEVSPDPI